MMNYYAFSMFVNGLVALVCGGTVLAHNPRSGKNGLFALFCASVSLWSLAYAKWQTSVDPAAALFWVRLALAGAIAIPCFHFHHIIKVLHQETVRRRKALAGGYAIAALMLISDATPLFIAGVRPESSFRFWPIPGVFLHVWLLQFLFFIGWSIGILWSLRRSPSPQQRRSAALLAVATICAYVAGLLNMPLWYGIPIKPVLNPVISVYIVINAIVLFDLGVWDVKSRFKKLSLIVVIYGSILAAVMPSAIPVTHYLVADARLPATTVVLGLSIALGGILSLGPVIYALVVRRSHWLRTHVSTGLAHELKSPLSAIEGAAAILHDLTSSSKLNPAQLNSYLGIIRGNADRLRQFVQELLQTASVHEFDVGIEKRSIAVETLLDVAAAPYQRLAEARGLNLSVRACPSLKVAADEGKISQAISNLLSNSFKFTECGEISVAAQRIDQTIAISVRDSGRGIGDEDLPHVFERFYQGKQTNRGAGIGLYIAKAWVEAHGGRIWAESEGEGKGTTVTFTLPAAGR